MFSKRKFSIICMALALAMFAAGCKKKVPAPALPSAAARGPTTPPPPAASDRCAAHGGAHLDSARSNLDVALGSHRQRHQRVH